MMLHQKVVSIIQCRELYIIVYNLVSELCVIYSQTFLNDNDCPPQAEIFYVSKCEIQLIAVIFMGFWNNVWTGNLKIFRLRRAGWFLVNLH